jgi:hypothetical protein
MAIFSLQNGGFKKDKTTVVLLKRSPETIKIFFYEWISYIIGMVD